MRNAVQALWRLCVAALVGCFASCASGEPGDEPQRAITIVDIAFDQTTVVRSSVLRFQFLDTADRQAVLGSVRMSGSLGEGRELDERIYLPVDRIGDKGDLVIDLRVADQLWDLVAAAPTRTLSGRIDLELEDEIGVFAVGSVDGLGLRFRAAYPPRVTPMTTGRDVFPDERLAISGDGFLRPEEGTTWAIVDAGRVTFEDGASRTVRNARVPVEWDGARDRALLPVSPSIFGVRSGAFAGSLRFENELDTGESFGGSEQAEYSAHLRRPRIDSLSPDRGSRGQKITIAGRGFVRPASDTSAGTYFALEGVLRPTEGGGDIVIDNDPVIITPFRVVDETRVEQDVSYSVDPVSRTLTGLGAVPGVFDGTITPYIYRGNEEQAGDPWRGTFEVLPTRQVVRVRYLPGFSRALSQYGLGVVESEVRDRIMAVIVRDYAATNLEVTVDEPQDFIEYTTIEIGGPDPSGLLNFGYDNSFNEGGKDVGNLYLSDYLGGVNRHSQDAGYLAYGGVFIESFIAFSPRLYPNNFGTSAEFDVVLSPFMPALGGEPVRDSEWPEGGRVVAVRSAIHMMGNLIGHTASHEIGHALGLAHFPPTVENFAERFHNDPPGARLIMDAGSDRPFTERAELGGDGPARFSDENLRYLQRILPRVE